MYWNFIFYPSVSVPYAACMSNWCHKVCLYRNIVKPDENITLILLTCFLANENSVKFLKKNPKKKKGNKTFIKKKMTYN